MQEVDDSKTFIIDKMMIKGVNFNRAENDNNMDYLLSEGGENDGMRYYIHRYFLGLHPYYLSLRQNVEFKDSNVSPKMHPREFMEL